jgi:hypothetical protein
LLFILACFATWFVWVVIVQQIFIGQLRSWRLVSICSCALVL